MMMEKTISHEHRSECRLGLKQKNGRFRSEPPVLPHEGGAE